MHKVASIYRPPCNSAGRLYVGQCFPKVLRSAVRTTSSLRFTNCGAGTIGIGMGRPRKRVNLPFYDATKLRDLQALVFIGGNFRRATYRSRDVRASSCQVEFEVFSNLSVCAIFDVLFRP